MWLPCAGSTPHRAEAHTIPITGILGYFVESQLPAWQENLQNEHNTTFSRVRHRRSFFCKLPMAFFEFMLRLLAGPLARLLAGYASHLAVDSLTPGALPILC